MHKIKVRYMQEPSGKDVWLAYFEGKQDTEWETGDTAFEAIGRLMVTWGELHETEVEVESNA